MGIFDFLKKGSKKKTEEIEQIKLNGLNPWISEQSKKQYDAVNSKIDDIRKKIDQEKEKLGKNIEKLESGKLKNPKIIERAKHMMEGNRKNYLQQTKMLLSKFVLPEDFDQTLKFCDGFDTDLKYFGKSTARNFHILQEFFGHEVKNIASNISNLNKHVKNIKKTIENSGMDKITRLKNKTKEIQQKIIQKQELEQKIEKLKQDLEKQEKEIKEKHKKVQDLLESTEYKGFIALNETKDSLKKQLSELEKKQFHSFSVIKAALKKFERLTLEDKLIRKYLDDSLIALLGDLGFKIINEFEKMKDMIKSGELELKDAKKETILEELDRVGGDYFKDLVAKYKECEEELKDINAQIEKSDIVKQVDNLRDFLDRDKKDLEQNQNIVKELAGQLEEINVEQMKKELEEKIREDLGEEVVIQ
jgi:chromosome segregation ATPase